MRRRLLLGAGALALLVALAGCSTVFGPGEPDPEQINQNVTYDWNTSANATVEISDSEYRSVYVIDNRSEIELYQRDALGTEHPLEIQGLKFQFENGTTTNISVENVELTRNRAIVTLPAEDGKVAFTAPHNGKSWSSPTFVEGSYEVTLPESGRVGVPILAQVSPGGYTTTLDADRVTLRWDSVGSRSVSARWYLTRDLWLFGGLIGIALLIGIGGAAYYLRQIRALERQREEIGLDVDIEDDRDEPPPGMR